MRASRVEAEGGEAMRRPPARQARTMGGRLAVATMVGLGLALASYAVWHQRAQTRRCLDLFGAESAGRIASAGRVELWRVRPGTREGVLEVVSRIDISEAPGLVHLRRGLVEDANYSWAPTAAPREEHLPRPVTEAAVAPDRVGRDRLPGRLPAGEWDWAIAFADPPGPAEAADSAVLVVDLPDAAGAVAGTKGWLAVRGRPGRVALGRLGPALERWIKETGGLVRRGEGGKER